MRFRSALLLAGRVRARKQPEPKRRVFAGFARLHSVAIGATPAIVRANPHRADNKPQSLRNDVMLTTPAFAQGILGFGGDGGMITSLLPFVLIFVIMYFLILRPQQKRVKTHQEMVKNVRRGDTVITNGGLVGKVTKVVDENEIEIEIADEVRIRQVRSMIAEVRAKGEPVKEVTAAS
jgi:preprotein translocase subunit YajC